MTFEVKVFESRSRQGFFHAVTIIDDVACQCSCESWAFKKVPCWKMLEIGVAA